MTDFGLISDDTGTGVPAVASHRRRPVPGGRHGAPADGIPAVPRPVPGIPEVSGRADPMARALLDQASEFHVVCGADGTVHWVSGAVTTVLGYQPDEYAHAASWSLVHPEDAARLSALVDGVVSQPGARRRAQYRVRAADGTIRWVEATITNHLGRPGVDAVVHTVRDVTARVAAKKRLNERGRQLRAIVSSAADVIVLLDPTGRIDYVTPSIAPVLGRSSRSVEDGWRSLVHTDDAPAMVSVFESALDSPGVTRGPVDVRMRHGDGTWRVMEVFVTDFRADPVVRGVVVNARDVTARRRAEDERRAEQKLFNTLVEMAPVGIVLTDADGAWTYVNARVADDHGAERGELLGWGWCRYFADHDVDRVRREITGWDGRDRYVTELGAADGSGRRWRLTLSRPELDGDRRGAVGTLEDVTSRRDLDEMLLGGAALGSVAGVVGSAAHDLHNLLASVGFQLGLLEVDGTTAARVEAAEEAVDRACEIAEDLMSLSRPGRRAAELVPIGALLVDLTGMLEVLVEHRADLVLDIAEGAGATCVRVDPGGLERVVTNLVVNARDAVSPRGRIEVRVSCRDLDAAEAPGGRAGRFAVVEVVDDGCGIPAALMEEIFEPYVTTKPDGNGIGLAASRRMVRGWGGELTASSEPGRGTTMTVLLPVAEPG